MKKAMELLSDSSVFIFGPIEQLNYQVHIEP